MFNRKVCTKCKKEFPFSKFQHHPHGKYGLKPRCVDCCREDLNKWRKEHPEHFRKIGWTWELKKQYNMTPDEYQELLEKQNFGCAICGETSKRVGKYMKLAVDHNHETGKIRGLLCDSCNRGIGHLKTISNLRKAVFYLLKE